MYACYGTYRDPQREQRHAFRWPVQNDSTNARYDANGAREHRNVPVPIPCLHSWLCSRISRPRYAFELSVNNNRMQAAGRRKRSAPSKYADIDYNQGDSGVLHEQPAGSKHSRRPNPPSAAVGSEEEQESADAVGGSDFDSEELTDASEDEGDGDGGDDTDADDQHGAAAAAGSHLDLCR